MNRLCLRASAAAAASSPSRPVLTLRGIQATTSLGQWHTKRIFASTPRHRKDVVSRQSLGDKDKDKVVAAGKKNSSSSSRKDPLLAEQTVSNKEQRKADWAIIKDMSKYLWPKNDFGTRFRVGLSVALLISAKVGNNHSSAHSSFHACAELIEYVGPECASSILLQIHHRLDEH